MRPRRFYKLQTAAAQRRFDVVPVLENVVNPRNAAAVMRVADAFGIAHMRIVSSLEVQGITAPDTADDSTSSAGPDMGASRWLSVRTHDSSQSCVEELQGLGFKCLAAELEASQPLEAVLDKVFWPDRIALATNGALLPPQRSPGIAELAVRGPALPSAAAHCAVPNTARRVALFMGNEHRGVSKRLSRLCDQRFHLQQSGFVQSLNLAVATGIALHSACASASRADLLLSPEPQALVTWAGTESCELEEAAERILARHLPESRPGRGASELLDEDLVGSISERIHAYDAFHGEDCLDLPERWPDAEGVALVWSGESPRGRQARDTIAEGKDVASGVSLSRTDDVPMNPLQRRWKALATPGSALERLSVAAHNHDLFVMDSRRLRLLVTWLLRVLSGNTRNMARNQKIRDPRVLEILDTI